MNATEEEAKALGLTEEQLLLFTTPFKDLSKEGAAAAFALGDRVANYRWTEKQRLRDEETAKLSEEEKIHADKENMIKLKRNFY